MECSPPPDSIDGSDGSEDYSFCLVHWAGGMRANGARSKQLDQATFEVRLLDDAIDGVVLVSLLGLIALLPLRCGGFKQYGKAAIAIAIAVGLTSMGVACAMCAGPMGTCGLFVDHICGDRYPGEANAFS
eukprot:s1187_g3.t1